jgi:hypothetical protein
MMGSQFNKETPLFLLCSVPELARSNVLEMFPMKKKGGKRD